MLTTERYAPSFAGKGAFPPILRLSIAIGAVAGLGLVYQRSCLRFYGWTENNREVEMDMREMVAKVKKGEPLYGESELTPYVQGMAARNSRYSSLLFHVVPFANFVNHNQVSPHRECRSTSSDTSVSMVSTLRNIISKRSENSKRRNREIDGRPSLYHRPALPMDAYISSK